jgi:hypothetical protein
MEDRLRTTLEATLRSPMPLYSLREVVRQRLDGTGVAHEQVRNELKEFRSWLREQGRSDDEDVVLDVLDLLAGFSSSRMSLAEGVSHLPTPMLDEGLSRDRHTWHDKTAPAVAGYDRPAAGRRFVDVIGRLAAIRRMMP